VKVIAMSRKYEMVSLKDVYFDFNFQVIRYRNKESVIFESTTIH
jgi:hypothetical protein